MNEQRNVELIDNLLEELEFAKTQSDLNDLSSMVAFFKSYYMDELMKLQEERDKREGKQTRKAPLRRDVPYNARKHKLDDMATRCALLPHQFVENMQHNRFIHRPPSIPSEPSIVADKYISPQFNTGMAVMSNVCRFLAQQLGAHPYLRKLNKKLYMDKAMLETKPTELG